jgi:hypothetical protein
MLSSQIKRYACAETHKQPKIYLLKGLHISKKYSKVQLSGFFEENSR